MSEFKTELYDRQKQSYVEATLVTDLTPAEVVQTENVWATARESAVADAIAAGGAVPEHFHWDWSKKADKLNALAYTGMAIKCDSATQGLMMLRTVGRLARLPPEQNKEIVYVEYLETAPWNLSGLVGQPRFALVGVRLIEAAVRHSEDDGFSGRLGLHSLPQAERFYERTCKMQSLGKDPLMENLTYFEFTSAAADEFLRVEDK